MQLGWCSISQNAARLLEPGRPRSAVPGVERRPLDLALGHQGLPLEVDATDDSVVHE